MLLWMENITEWWNRKSLAVWALFGDLRQTMIQYVPGISWMTATREEVEISLLPKCALTYNTSLPYCIYLTTDAALQAHSIIVITTLVAKSACYQMGVLIIINLSFMSLHCLNTWCPDTKNNIANAIGKGIVILIMVNSTL